MSEGVGARMSRVGISSPRAASSMGESWGAETAVAVAAVSEARDAEGGDDML